MIEYNIKINLQAEREQYENIVFTTGDKRGYRLHFDFYSNGKKMDVSKYALTVKAKRSDGAVIIDSGTANADGAYYVVADNAYDIPGALEMEIALVGMDGSLATTVVLSAQVREGFGESGLSSADNEPVLVKLEAQYLENRAALNAHKSDAGAHSEALAQERSISNRQYANAIRGTASGGGVIQLDDVSPLGHTVKVKVSSKNVFRSVTDYTGTSNGVSVEYNSAEQEFTLNGTTASTGDIILIPSLSLDWDVGNKYTLTVFNTGGSATVGEGSGITYSYSLFSQDITKTFRSGDLSATTFPVKTSFTSTAIAESGGAGLRFYLQCWRVGTVFDNYKIKVQIEAGTQSTDYTPYEALAAGEANLFDVSKLADGLFYDEEGTDVGMDGDYEYFVPETLAYENCLPSYTLEVQSGKRYTISGYARDMYASDTQTILVVSTSEEIGTVEGETLGTCSGDGSMDTWTYFELSFTIPDDVTVVYFYLSQMLGYKDIVLKKESPRLTVCGKNLFDSSKLLAASGWQERNGLYWGLPNDTYILYGGTSENGLVSGIFLPNTQYTFSFTGYSYTNTSNIGMTFGFKYDDGTSDNVYITANSATNYVLTSDENKTIVRLNTSLSYNYVTFLSNIQLEKGAVATEYEPYASTTYTPSADGTVEIPSASPSMAVLSDAEGINIDLEYNRDTNAVINEMANAIIALGGTL